VVQNAPMSTKPSSPPSKPIRLTITVTPEVHAGFQRLADASGMSLGRCMGEWLGDTLEAVEYTATMVEKARAAPKMVMREVHAYALGLADETGQLMDSLAGRGGRERTRALAAVAAAPSPPVSNTGGKVPQRASGKVGSSKAPKGQK
jgi:hypothetical protein